MEYAMFIVVSSLINDFGFTDKIAVYENKQACEQVLSKIDDDELTHIAIGSALDPLLGAHYVCVPYPNGSD